jgi:hypothetical protein
MTFDREAWLRSTFCGAVNCLGYALNAPEAGSAQPGHLINTGGIFYMGRTSRVRELLIREGLRPISEREALTGKYHAVALVLSEDDDFHFHRRDNSTGLWSHKRGGNLPENYDEDGKPIENPRFAESPVYKEFGGFFAVPEEGILYKPRVEIPADIVKSMTGSYRPE